MRVMLVADAVGGVWDFALSLAGGLIHYAGASVLLVVVGPPPDAAHLAAAAAVPGLEHRILDGRLEWMEGGRDWLAAWRRGVAAHAAEWKAEIVHVNQLGLAAVRSEPCLAALPRRPPVVLGVHSDVVTWWLWVKDGGRGPCTFPDYLSWQRDLAGEALGQADVVVCPSAFLARELAACYRLTQLPVVVHNAVAEVPFSPSDDGAAPPGAPGTPSGLSEIPGGREPGLAVVAGRVWDEAKNLAVVAEALRRSREPWRAEVAGEVVEPGRAGTPAPPAAPGLRYLGFLDKGRLARLYRRAGVCLAPSSYEPFGLAPAEAALAGCAIVANDLPSYREVWGDAAWYFRRNDPTDLAAVLDRLYGDGAALARLALAGRRRVAGRYTLRRMVAGYLRSYGAAGASWAAAQEGSCIGTRAMPAQRAMIPAWRKE
jgi:glycosyltransferase involved in cell wall biosynthesis